MSGDLSAFTRDLALDTKRFVSGYLSKALSGISERCDELQRQIAGLKEAQIAGPEGPPGIAGERGPEGPAGQNGKDADPEQVKALVEAAVSAATSSLGGLIRDEVTKAMAVVPVPRDGRDGKDADFGAIKALVDASVISAKVPAEDVASLVREHVTKALESMPLPKDGKDGTSVTVADVQPMVAAEVATAMKSIPMPKDGKDGITPKVEDLKPAISVVAYEVVSNFMKEIPTPRDGVSVTVEDVRPLIASEVHRAVATIPAPKDGRDGKDGDPGKSIDPSDVEDMIADWVTKAVAALPTPKDGVSVTVDEIRPLVLAEVAEAVKSLPTPKDGKSVTVDDVAPLIASQLESAVKAIPVPKDGASVTVDDIAPLVEREVTKAVSAIPVPKDGVGIVNALVDRSGHLVLTRSDGGVQDVGLVNGKDVDPDYVAQVIEAKVAEAVAKMPPPKDGEPGRDGTLENMKVERVDERHVQWCFKDGTPVEGGLQRLNHPVFRGKWVHGVSYDKDDLVQWDGSGWIAIKDRPSQRPAYDKPPEVTGWRLFIKRGEKGRDGKPAEPGF